MQYVKVDLKGRRAYTYGWAGYAPLRRGDRVTVPGNTVTPEPQTGIVLRVLAEPDYDVDKIVEILSAKRPRR